MNVKAETQADLIRMGWDTARSGPLSSEDQSFGLSASGTRLSPVPWDLKHRLEVEIGLMVSSQAGAES